MDWDEEQNHLTEQLEILKKLKEYFGEEVIEIASSARLSVHKKWMKKLSKRNSGRPSEIFKHSAFSVTSAEENLLEYEVLEDSDTTNYQGRSQYLNFTLGELTGTIRELGTRNYQGTIRDGNYQGRSQHLNFTLQSVRAKDRLCQDSRVTSFIGDVLII